MNPGGGPPGPPNCIYGFSVIPNISSNASKYGLLGFTQVPLATHFISEKENNLPRKKRVGIIVQYTIL